MNGDDIAKKVPATAGKHRVGLCAVFIASAVLSGCSGPIMNACTAIGWANTLTVTLDGGTADVSLVQLCIDDECSAPAPSEPYSNEPAPSEILGPEDFETYTPDPRVKLPYFASKINDHSWKIALSMSSPDKVTLRAFSASGILLAEEDVTLSWVRVGGSERCGGPEEAAPVTLEITT